MLLSQQVKLHSSYSLLTEITCIIVTGYRLWRRVEAGQGYMD